MKKVVATLFTGLAILTATPSQAEDLYHFSASESAPIAQTNTFEAQEVRFRGGRGFRRGGFRRGGFRRGGFRHGGFRRGRFRRGGFRRRRFRHNGFRHHDFKKFRKLDKFDKFEKFEHHDKHPDAFKRHEDFKET